MFVAIPSFRQATRFRRWCIIVCLALCLCIIPGQGGSGMVDEAAKDDPPKTAMAPGDVKVSFTDDSFLKLSLREERLTLQTTYGKLLVPIVEVQRIEFATRVSEETGKRIATCITNLGNPSFQAREDASAALLNLAEKAYPALLKAAESKDMEVSRRAELLLEKIRGLVPEEKLTIRPYDVVHTAHSKIAGRIEGETLKAMTSQFGEVKIKLADIRELRSPSADSENDLASAIPYPGSLANIREQVGKTFVYKVTGEANNTVWGTDVYTWDSSVPIAAVHAGILKVGQTGIVRVKIVGNIPVFVGSTRNGVTSSPWGAYPSGFRFIK